MLIDLKAVVKGYGWKVSGVIQVGAHHGQEYATYLDLGIQDCVFIEPCWEAFTTLSNNLLGMSHVIFFHCACGEKEGIAVMHVSSANNGQSNSLLRPKKHLEHYPTITFEETEEVAVRRLDSLPISPGRYNLLVMDVQGAELLVLKGATETLRHIEYIYTEVNNQELYEDCAQVDQLDAYLTDFERVETFWVPKKGWGDAIYIRRKYNF